MGGNLVATTDDNNGVINLGTLAVDGTVQLTTNGSGNATVVNDAGLNFAASTVGGNLTATATTGNIADTGALTIAGTSSFTTSANNADIRLNNTNALTGAVALNTTGSSGNAWVDNGTTSLNIARSSVGGYMWLISGNNITDSGTVTVGVQLQATTDGNNGLINLGTLAVDGTVRLITNGTGNATVVNDAGLKLKASTVGGNLIATATTGDMEDSGMLTIAGTSSFTTSATDADIILNNANAFTGSVAFNTTGSSGNATVVDASGLNLGASTVGGNLSATATTGNMEDSGVLTIAGTSSFTTSANNATITLDNTNAFTGAVTLSTTGSTGHSTIDNGITAFNIGASSVGGNLTLTSGHASGITDSGTVTVGGNLVARTNENSGVINLGTLAVDGTVALATHGTGNATVVNSTSLKLRHGSSVGGNLSATATTGNITDSTALTIKGASSFITSANNADIILNNTNAFTGAVGLNTTGLTGHATIDNGITALDIGASSVGGNLTLTGGHASGIIDSGTVTVGGNLAATTDANNGVIDLGTLAVDGTVAVNTNGTGNATLVNATSLRFADSLVGGNLSATASSGDLQFEGSVGAVKNVVLEATGGSILNNLKLNVGNIEGEIIALIAANKIGTTASWLEIDAKTLNASTTSKNPNSDIYIIDEGNLILASLRTENGSINIASDGPVTQKQVIAGGLGNLVNIKDRKTELKLQAAELEEREAAELKEREAAKLKEREAAELKEREAVKLKEREAATATAQKKKRLATMAAAIDIPLPPTPKIQITPIAMPSSRSAGPAIAATPLIGISKPGGGSAPTSGRTSPGGGAKVDSGGGPGGGPKVDSGGEPGGGNSGGGSGGPKEGGPKEGGPKEGGPKEGGPKEGGSKEGGPKEGGPKEGGSKEGGPKEGGPKEGGSKEGGSEEGGSEEGGSEEGGSEEGGSEEGGSEEEGSEEGGSEEEGSEEEGSEEEGSEEEGSEEEESEEEESEEETEKVIIDGWLYTAC